MMISFEATRTDRPLPAQEGSAPLESMSTGKLARLPLDAEACLERMRREEPESGSTWLGWISKPWSVKSSVQAPENPVQPKSWGSWFAEKCGQVKDAAVWQGLNLAKNIATYGYQPDRVDSQKIAELKALTRTDEHVPLIDHFAGQLADSALKKIKESTYSDTIKQFAAKEGLLIRQLINSGMLNLFVNLAQSARAETACGEAVTLGAIVEHLARIAEECCPDFQQEMKKINLIAAEAERKEALRAYLFPLVETLMEKGFPNGADDIAGIGFGKEYVYNFLYDTAIPAVVEELADSYYFPLKNHEAWSEELKHCLGEQKARFVSVGCKFTAAKIRDALRLSLDEGAEELSAAYFGSGASKEKIKALSGSLKQIAGWGHEAGIVWPQIALQLETMLMKTACHYAQQLPEHLAPHEAVLQALNFLIDEVQRETPPSFPSIAAKLLKNTGWQPEEDLPHLFGLNRMLWDQIETKVLPDFLQKTVCEATAWTAKKEENKKELQKLFGTQHPQEACKVLGEYIRQFIPWYLSTAQTDVAAMLAGSLEKMLESDPEAKPLLALFKEHKTEILALLQGEVAATAESKADHAAKLWELSGEYAEAAFLEIMVRIGKRIKAIESASENQYGQDTVTALLKKMRDHLAAVNQAKENAGVHSADNLSDRQVFQHMGAGLHHGIALGAAVSAEEQQSVKLADYSAFAKKVLQAVELENGADAPLPSPIKRQAFSLFRQQILPHVLMSLMDKVNDDYSKNAILVGLLDVVNESLADIDFLKVLAHDAAEIAEPQETDVVAGELVKEIITLLPPSMTHGMANYLEIIQEVSSAMIGKSLRSYFQGKSVLEVIDKAVKLSIPHLHPGKWQGEKGEESFAPQGASYSFDLPKTPEEQEAKAKKLKKAALRKQKEFVDKGAKSLSAAFANFFAEGIKSLWRAFTNTVGSIIPAFKGFIDSILNFALTRFILNGFARAAKGIGTVLQTILEKTVLKKKLKAINHNTHLSYHQNLLLWWRDILVDSLNDSKIKDLDKEKKKERS